MEFVVFLFQILDFIKTLILLQKRKKLFHPNNFPLVFSYISCDNTELKAATLFSGSMRLKQISRSSKNGLIMFIVKHLSKLKCYDEMNENTATDILRGLWNKNL